MTTLSENYPYPELTKQLQFLCQPAQYQKITAGRMYPIDSLHSAEYLDILPKYIFAQCPICGKRYSQLADTYTVYSWHSRSDHFATEDYKSNEATCKHFLGIHRFVNLHDQEPLGTDYFPNGSGEAPRLTPWFLPDDIQSFVVLHGLPICRIVEEEFVPSYTLFILTYFCDDPKGVLKRHYEVQAKYGKDDHEFYPGFFTQPEIYKKGVEKIPASYYALGEKAEQGQLGWMDYTKPDLPLSIGAGKQLPEIYRSIEGKRYKYEWRNGKFNHH